MLEEVNKTFPRLATAYQYLIYQLRRSQYKIALCDQAKKLLLEIKTQGYAVVDNFFTLDECTSIREEIPQIFKQRPEYVHRRSDQRFFGIDKLIPLARDFATYPLFQELASAVNRAPTRTAFTLANILSASTQGSSGEGWHRDSFFSQFKSMVYLTDVNEENGPFEILVGSHRLEQILKDIKTADLNCMQNRLSDNEVDKLIAKHPERLKTFIAPAGTLILFNSSTIHRGRPIKSGQRIAMTNYMFEESQIGDWMLKHFAPLYPHPIK
jgi:hypothetical protein